MQSIKEQSDVLVLYENIAGSAGVLIDMYSNSKAPSGNLIYELVFHSESLGVLLERLTDEDSILKSSIEDSKIKIDTILELIDPKEIKNAVKNNTPNQDREIKKVREEKGVKKFSATWKRGNKAMSILIAKGIVGFLCVAYTTIIHPAIFRDLLSGVQEVRNTLPEDLWSTAVVMFHSAEIPFTRAQILYTACTLVSVLSMLIGTVFALNTSLNAMYLVSPIMRLMLDEKGATHLISSDIKLAAKQDEIGYMETEVIDNLGSLDRVDIMYNNLELLKKEVNADKRLRESVNYSKYQDIVNAFNGIMKEESVDPVSDLRKKVKVELLYLRNKEVLNEYSEE